MKLSFSVTLFFLVIMFAFSCSGDNDDTTTDDMTIDMIDTTGLKIIIHSPANNQLFNMGDTIILSYTVTDDVDITTIAWSTKNKFGTGSVTGSNLLGDITEYSGEFVIVASAEPGTYDIDVIATDAGFINVKEESVTIIIQ